MRKKKTSKKYLKKHRTGTANIFSMAKMRRAERLLGKEAKETSIQKRVGPIEKSKQQGKPQHNVKEVIHLMNSQTQTKYQTERELK